MEIPSAIWFPSATGHAHHTYNYTEMGYTHSKLIVRRGQEFDLTINHDGYTSIADQLTFVFTLLTILRDYGTRKTPIVHRVSMSDFAFASGFLRDKMAWSATRAETLKHAMRVKVYIPPDAPIGKWNVDIIHSKTTFLRSETKVVTCFNCLPLYVLFNPWNSDDVVYLDEEDARQEYVMANAGLVWKGNLGNIYPIYWKYSQFDANILDIAFYLMGLVPADSRNDSVVISRTLSAAINSFDDDGVLVGRWNGKYDDGVAPQAWSDSKDILLQYYTTNKSVKYGQCWVFAALYTTVSRAIGLPCRPVTNYVSHHDENGDCRGTRYIDIRGNILPREKEMTWNFHVWSEVWMKRLDMNDRQAMNGWQAVDATPQTISAGLYQIGPAPVKAIRSAIVDHPKCLDCKLIFAAVNAEISIVLVENSNSVNPTYELVGKDTALIGSNISTKAIGKWEREDITDNYKYPEGSLMSELLGIFGVNWINNLTMQHFTDITFDLKLPTETLIGQTFTITLSMTNNKWLSSYKVRPILRVDIEGDDGFITPVKISNFEEIVLSPKTTTEVNLHVTWAEYGLNKSQKTHFKASTLVHISSKKYHYYKSVAFNLKNPEIHIEMPLSGELFPSISVEFTNPLPIPMTNCFFRTLTDDKTIRNIGNIPAGGTVHQFFRSIPTPGTKLVFFSIRITSNEFSEGIQNWSMTVI